MLRDALGARPDLTEKPMFGGWVWLLHGHLLCGAREDGVLVRLGKGNDAWALALPGIEPMRSRSRAMAGRIRVAPETFADDALAARLLREAIAFVQTLLPK
ncbi:TfoX/Sxy family protein [Xanthomonas medicagonis]|uniref:TfoX/Sxy family protein n=1 Tax=Xanthomonas medicagonis TaxID=3160841 RepID=UPI003514813E